MRTAEDVLDVFNNVLFATIISDEDKLNVIKRYAKQVAQQALKDAGENVRCTDCMHDVLTTEIKLP